jgi:tRNA 2-thiouridine synthesizing protein A
MKLISAIRRPSGDHSSSGLTLAPAAREIQPVTDEAKERIPAGDLPPAADAVLDARDLACPLPVLKARRRLAGMAPGTCLLVEATDPMAAVDLPNLCREDGHRLVWSRADGGILRFLVEKGG